MWERDFQALYMWDPINEGWGDFKKEYFQYYDRNTIYKKKYSFIDPAISQKESADYTAIITIWITADNQIYILDIYREKALPDEIIDNALRIAEQFKVDVIWIETIQYQKMLALELRKQMLARNQLYKIHEMKPSGEKEARIRSVLQPRYSLMTIHHKLWWHNVAELETEALKFPNWTHDDMIDALSSCIAMASIEYWLEVNATEYATELHPYSYKKKDEVLEFAMPDNPY